MQGYHRMPDGSMMRDGEMVGPPGMGEADMRLAALKAHQKGMAEAPPAADAPQLHDLILPLIIAQGLDLVSTERLVGLNGQINPAGLQMHTREGNPMPGMQSSGGRVGLAGLESLVLAMLHRKNPGLAKKLADASTVGRTGLAFGNEQMRQEQLNYGGPLDALRRGRNR